MVAGRGFADCHHQFGQGVCGGERGQKLGELLQILVRESGQRGRNEESSHTRHEERKRVDGGLTELAGEH